MIDMEGLRPLPEGTEAGSKITVLRMSAEFRSFQPWLIMENFYLSDLQDKSSVRKRASMGLA